MKVKTIKSVAIITVLLLATVMFAQQQTITYENFPKAQMMLIGIPLNFGDADPGAVLTPVFGEQIRGDEVYWRFSRWNIGDQTYYRYGEEEFVWDHSTQAYTGGKAEQGSPPDIEPGYGYWLAQSSGNTVTNFSLTGTPAAQDQPVYVTVDPPETVQGNNYPGINMVANPFLYTIDWANAQYRINGETEVTLEQAVNMGLVSQYAYPWDGDQYTPFNMTDGGKLGVWDGYWVEMLNPAETEYVVYSVACDFDGEGESGEDCGTCPDKNFGMLRYLQLRYDGPEDAYIVVYDNKWRRLFSDDVAVGGSFDYYGVQNKQGLGPKNYIYVYYDDKCISPDEYVEIHTSCSVAIGVGSVFGSFTVLAGENKNGIALCPLEDINRPIIRFYNPGTALGEGGAIETDRFTISLSDDDNDELAFNTFTTAGDSSGWTALTTEGTAVADGQGFTVTLISEDGEDYIIDVAGTGSQTAALTAVKFRFGDDQSIVAPECGETFTSTRSLLNGESVTTLELKTPPIDAGGKMAKSTAKIPHPLKAESLSEWIIPLSVSSQNGEMVDSYNGFGVKTEASAMFDLLDARNFTPNLDAWVDIYFPHHQANDPRNYWPENPMKVSYDVRPEAAVIAWDFNLAYYYAANEKLTIRWDASQFPADMELTLVDFNNDTRTDMLANSEYTVTTPADDWGTLYFAVVAAEPEEVVGIENNGDKPVEFRLLANYPNPFNATTRLQYSLPEAAKVTLAIYNLNGNLVNTLVNGYQSGGIYEMEWNGRDRSGAMVSTGVYLYQLKANAQVLTRKMVLMK